MINFKSGDIVCHSRNEKEYTILGRAWDTRTDEWLVLYQANYDDAQLGERPLFVRAESVFAEIVEGKYPGEKVPRFSLVKKAAEAL